MEPPRTYPKWVAPFIYFLVWLVGAVVCFALFAFIEFSVYPVAWNFWTRVAAAVAVVLWSLVLDSNIDIETDADGIEE